MMVQDEHGVRSEKEFIIKESELGTLFPYHDLGGGMFGGSFGGGSDDFNRRKEIVDAVKKREYHAHNLCCGNGAIADRVGEYAMHPPTLPEED